MEEEKCRGFGVNPFPERVQLCALEIKYKRSDMRYQKLNVCSLAEIRLAEDDIKKVQNSCMKFCCHFVGLDRKSIKNIQKPWFLVCSLKTLQQFVCSCVCKDIIYVVQNTMV